MPIINQPFQGQLGNIIISEFSGLVHKIEMCNKLLGVDTVRCKLELGEIEQSARKIMQMLKKIK